MCFGLGVGVSVCIFIGTCVCAFVGVGIGLFVRAHVDVFFKSCVVCLLQRVGLTNEYFLVMHVKRYLKYFLFCLDRLEITKFVSPGCIRTILRQKSGEVTHDCGREIFFSYMGAGG